MSKEDNGHFDTLTPENRARAEKLIEQLLEPTEDFDAMGARGKVPPAPPLRLTILPSRTHEEDVPGYVMAPDSYDLPPHGDTFDLQAASSFPATEEVNAELTKDADPGRKFDQDKPDWMLAPMHAVEEVVKVLTYGAKKYSPDNWKKVPGARRRYGAALLRHCVSYLKGETHDPETGFHHLAHAACCILYLMEFDRLNLNP